MVLENFAPVLIGGALTGVFIVSRFIFGLLCRAEGYSLTTETTVNDNPALGIRYAFFLLSVVVALRNIIHPSGINIWEDLNVLSLYSVLIIAMLLVSRYVNDWFILSGFKNNKEVIGEGNTAVATVEGATFLATALNVSGAFAGFEGGFAVSLVWFAVGQGLLIALAYAYRKIIPETFAELDTHNNACAFSLAGLLVAAGMTVGAAVSGPFHSWRQDLTAVGVYIVGWIVFMTVFHLISNKITLPSTTLKKEIISDRNVAAGVVDGVSFIAATLIYTYVADDLVTMVGSYFAV